MRVSEGLGYCQKQFQIINHGFWMIFRDILKYVIQVVNKCMSWLDIEMQGSLSPTLYCLKKSNDSEHISVSYSAY